MKSVNTVVIGAGPGGYVAAIRLAQLGVPTALVERGPLGGVCLNWGCIPSKAYIHAAAVYEHIATASEIGLLAEEPEVDLAKMKGWKDGIVKRLTSGIGSLLQKAGVEIIKGEASFKDANTLALKGGDAEEIRFEHAMIATGSRSLDIPPFPRDGEAVISSTEALDLEEVPENLVVIGGGVIGLEIGMYLNRFGANLTVIEMMDQVLPGTDPDVVKVLMRVLKKRKIKVHTESKALGFKKKGGAYEVEFEDKKGKKSAAKADKILVSVGRVPNSDGLGLENAKVATDDRGFILIDEQRRTSTRHIFAIGDVAGGALLAHKASKEGLVAAAVIAGQNEIYDVRAMPAAIFTEPEIAMVGISEAEAKEQGLEVRSGTFPLAALGKAMAIRATDGFVKIVSEAESDRVLGVHIIGHGASDIISEAALAIEMGACAEDIALTVHPHPTMGESMMEAAEAVHGKAIHIFNP